MTYKPFSSEGSRTFENHRKYLDELLQFRRGRREKGVSGDIFEAWMRHCGCSNEEVMKRRRQLGIGTQKPRRPPKKRLIR